LDKSIFAEQSESKKCLGQEEFFEESVSTTVFVVGETPTIKNINKLNILGAKVNNKSQKVN